MLIFHPDHSILSCITGLFYSNIIMLILNYFTYQCTVLTALSTCAGVQPTFLLVALILARLVCVKIPGFQLTAPFLSDL